MAGNSRYSGESVTEKVLSIFNIFTVKKNRFTLSEISRLTDLPLSTTHRLVGELTNWKALHRASDGKYEIGSKMWSIGMLAPIASELRVLAQPIMNDLFVATGENVHLAILDGDKALYIEKVAGQKSVPVISRVGDRLPLHSTGVGKVLLAYAERQLIEHILKNLTQITSHTITSPAIMKKELAQVRRDGYAKTNEEMTLGTYSLAVPVFSSVSLKDENVIAALGLVVRKGRRDLERLAPALEVASRAITRRTLSSIQRK